MTFDEYIENNFENIFLSKKYYYPKFDEIYIDKINTSIFNIKIKKCLETYCSDDCCLSVSLIENEKFKIMIRENEIEPLNKINKKCWFSGSKTTKLNEKCVFLQKEERGCILQRFNLKPFYCQMFPLGYMDGYLFAAKFDKLPCFNDGDIIIYDEYKKVLERLFGADLVEEIDTLR